MCTCACVWLWCVYDESELVEDSVGGDEDRVVVGGLVQFEGVHFPPALEHAHHHLVHRLHVYRARRRLCHNMNTTMHVNRIAREGPSALVLNNQSIK